MPDDEGGAAKPLVADEPPPSADLVVVGAGIVGLAVARELLLRRPRLAVAVLEREPEIGRHQTSHNSGVIHAGIYYRPGSLKARLCVAGSRALYDYCDRRSVPYRRSGKLVIARDAREAEMLDELERRALANGVPGLRRLDGDELREIEPHAQGVAALHSPATGVVDFAAVAAALAEEVRAAGATVTTGCEVSSIDARGRWLRLGHGRGETRACNAVFCAGAWSDRLARAAGGSPDPRIVPFRGAYLRLRPERRELVRGLIYPVPDPSLPFLGVHLTRELDGEVLIGPTALLAPARDAYSLRRIVPGDAAATLAWPGTWRMARRFWRTGVTEVSHALRPRQLVALAGDYVPAIRPADVAGGPAGVRAQAVARDGTLVDDFVLSRTERALHVRNAPSPAATSALEIARLVADEAERAFDLEPRSAARAR